MVSENNGIIYVRQIDIEIGRNWFDERRNFYICILTVMNFSALDFDTGYYHRGYFYDNNQDRTFLRTFTRKKTRKNT